MRGQKFCPVCNKSTGPRSKVCECGHEFEFKLKQSYSKPEQKTVQNIPVKTNTENINPPVQQNPFLSSTLRNIIVPAGKCPVKLDKGIDAFVEGIAMHAKENGVNYLPSVYEYWAGTIIDKFSDEGKETIRKIKDYVIHKGI